MTVNFDGLMNVLWTQLWQVTLLIPLAIGAVRIGCRRRSHLGYVILLAVLVKCLVPPLWSSPTGVFSWASHAIESLEEAPSATPFGPPVAANAVAEKSATPASDLHAGVSPSEAATEANSPGLSADSLTKSSPTPPTSATLVAPSTAGEATPQPLAIASIDWFQIGLAALLASWACGVVGVVGYLLAKRIYLERFHNDTRVDSKEELLSIVSECAIALDLRHRPDLVVTTHPTIPFVVGWWSPRLVIPKHIVDRSTTDDMRLIIAHELNHLRRWDTATNWIQLVVQAVWWFHPLVWWLNAEIRRWRESCCDEEVVARLKCQPSSYAHCLLNVLDFQASLRATSGLDSLSPFEVTKQRLQNIMQPSGKFPRSTPWGVWLAFIGLTLIVLPGAAFTLPEQEALAHDEIPSTPIVGEEEVGVKAPLDTPPAPPVAVVIPPVSVEPAGAPQLPPPPPQAATVAPDWKYKFDVHRDYQYEVAIEEEGLHGTTRHTGRPTIRATYVSGEQWALAISNPKLMSAEAPNPGDPFSRRMRPPRIPSPFERGYEFTIDAHGRLTEESGDGSLPLYLGNWASWLFGPLPDGNQPPEWEEQGTSSLSLTAEPTVGPFGTPDYSPFARPTETARLPATTHTKSKLSVKDGVLTLTCARTIRTDERVAGEPRIEVRDSSTWTFNTRLQVPTSRTGSGELIERQVNQTQKTPFKYTVRLLENDAPSPENKAAAQDALLPPGIATVTGIAPPASHPIDPDKKLEKGQKFIVEWNGSFFPGEVTEVPDRDAVKIHFPGWGDQFDELVPRKRLREPDKMQQGQAPLNR